MKPKVHGMVALLILALSLAAVAVDTVWLGPPAKAVRLPPPKPIADIAVPDPGRLQVVDRLQRRLGQLAALRPSGGRGPVNLRAFGYVPPSAGIGAQGEASIKPYQVTMAFTSPGGRFCVIDGRLYTEGGRLEGGEKVVRIEPRRVLIARGKQRRWLQVPLPVVEEPRHEG